MNRKQLRIAVGLISVMGLGSIFVFQNFYFKFEWMQTYEPIQQFLINRVIRYLLNDLFGIGLIYSIFRERKFVIFALWVQLMGFVFFFIPYLVLKLQFPAYNGPLINFIHRLILNPTLMLLLIPAFYFQRRSRGGI